MKRYWYLIIFVILLIGLIFMSLILIEGLALVREVGIQFINFIRSLL